MRGLRICSERRAESNGARARSYIDVVVQPLVEAVASQQYGRSLALLASLKPVEGIPPFLSKNRCQKLPSYSVPQIRDVTSSGLTSGSGRPQTNGSREK